MNLMLKIFTGLIVFLIALVACESDDNVLIDDLSTDQNTNQSILEYLESKTAFDSIVKVIQLTDMEDALSQQGLTFLAPTNEALISYLYVSSKNSLDDLDPLELAELLKMYIIPQVVEFKLSEDDGVLRFQNLRNDDLLFTFEKADWNSVPNQGPLSTTIVYVFDELNDKNNKRELTQTNNVQKSNGIIYVLSNSHVFSFIDLLED